MEAILLWVLNNLLPPFLVYLVMQLGGRWLPFTSLKLRLLPVVTLTDEAQQFLICRIRVRNNGRKIAYSCWPVLQDYPKELDPAVLTAQPIAWEFDPTQASGALFITRDLQPDEEAEFVVVFTSKLESENGAYLANVPTARRDNQHYLIGFPPGRYDFKVSVIGNNISIRPLKLRLCLTENGNATWSSLVVHECSLKRKIMEGR